jgi:tetratricopeptide (TPR) repeat protein
MKKTTFIVLIVAFISSHCTLNRMSDSAAKHRRGKSYTSCITLGTSLLEQRKYDEAIKEFKHATILKPDSDKAYNYMGIGYFMKKKFEKARKCFLKALTINPAYAAAYCNLGNLQFKEGKVDMAVATLNQAIAVIGDDALLHYSLGTILLLKGEIDQGFAHLKKVMEIDPRYLDGEKKFSFEASENVIPKPELFFRYACLYAAINNLEKTLQYLEKAKKEGFSEWERILHNDAFILLRDDPQIKKYLEQIAL